MVKAEKIVVEWGENRQPARGLIGLDNQGDSTGFKWLMVMADVVLAQAANQGASQRT